MSPTGNKHDVIARVELALADYHCLFGQPLADACPIDEVTGEVLPVVTIVTDNGGPFRIVGLLVVHHGPSGVEACPHQGQEPRAERVTRTRVRDVDLRAVVPFPCEISEALPLAERAEDYRVEHKYRASPPGYRLEPASRGPPRQHQHDHTHL